MRKSIIKEGNQLSYKVIHHHTKKSVLIDGTAACSMGQRGASFPLRRSWSRSAPRRRSERSSSETSGSWNGMTRS